MKQISGYMRFSILSLTSTTTQVRLRYAASASSSAVDDLRSASVAGENRVAGNAMLRDNHREAVVNMCGRIIRERCRLKMARKQISHQICVVKGEGIYCYGITFSCRNSSKSSIYMPFVSIDSRNPKALAFSMLDKTRTFD